jgi:hypothetical protein
MMKPMVSAILCFRVMWSATTVTKNSEGGYTAKGGMDMGPAADPGLEIKQPGIYWRRAGLYFDTKLDCERESKKHPRQETVCLPTGVIPKNILEWK